MLATSSLPNNQLGIDITYFVSDRLNLACKAIFFTFADIKFKGGVDSIASLRFQYCVGFSNKIQGFLHRGSLNNRAHWGQLIINATITDHFNNLTDIGALAFTSISGEHAEF